MRVWAEGPILSTDGLGHRESHFSGKKERGHQSWEWPAKLTGLRASPLSNNLTPDACLPQASFLGPERQPMVLFLKGPAGQQL